MPETHGELTDAYVEFEIVSTHVVGTTVQAHDAASMVVEIQEILENIRNSDEEFSGPPYFVSRTVRILSIA